MAQSFKAILINQDTFDPGLYVRFNHQRRALLFDLPDLRHLTNREILKITDCFVTHTHMDHFLGFDQILRVFLGRDWILRIYGPKGIIDNVGGKLRGYTWNLVENYEGELKIQVYEVTETGIFCQEFSSKKTFQPGQILSIAKTDPILRTENGFKIKYTILDHQIPCLGYMLEEDFKIQILKERLVDYNLEPGPWLTKFKQDIYAGLKDDTDYLITFKKSGKIIEKTFLFGDLKNAITKISPGKTIAYITDIIGSHENLEKILTTFSNCDMLFIEAGFLSSDVEQAKKTYHLTAQEAGKIAAMLNCKYLKVFHHSFRYKGMESELQKEAREAFLSHLPRPLS